METTRALLYLSRNTASALNYLSLRLRNQTHMLAGILHDHFFTHRIRRVKHPITARNLVFPRSFVVLMLQRKHAHWDALHRSFAETKHSRMFSGAFSKSSFQALSTRRFLATTVHSPGAGLTSSMVRAGSRIPGRHSQFQLLQIRR
jgi:hypothetical protein